MGSHKPKDYKKTFSKYQSKDSEQPQEYEKMNQKPQLCHQDVKMVSQLPKVSKMTADETCADLQDKEDKQDKKIWHGVEIDSLKKHEGINFVLKNTEAMAGYIVAKTVDGTYNYNAAKSGYERQPDVRDTGFNYVYRAFGKGDMGYDSHVKYLPMIPFDEAVREYKSTGNVKCFKE